MKLVKSHIFYVLSLTLLIILFYPAFAKEDFTPRTRKTLLNPKGTGDLYRRVYIDPIWYTDIYSQVKQHFLSVLDSAKYVGLDKSKYHYNTLKTPNDDKIHTAYDAHIFIDAVVSYCKDLYSGEEIDKQLDNNEISRKYVAADEAYLLENLGKIRSASDLDKFLLTLEPSNNDYKTLKSELRNQYETSNNAQIKQLVSSINYLRWIGHFHFSRYIVVNIPTATLQYYENSAPKLQMKVVVGKFATPTPLFSSYCNQVVLYPYWNVPKKIGASELLPKFTRKPSEMDAMNMQLVNDQGRVIDHHGIDWSAYDKNNFPYIFRQSTGCGNALGVIKFNLTDPFDVYMHDTNLKNKFLSTSRYFSHGCIRLEKPIELANQLLGEAIDSNYVKACMLDQDPIVKKMEKAVPVFVVYMTPEVTDGTVTFNKDVYKLYQ